MKIYKFQCKDCGSKKYEKLDEKTYRCMYCGCVEELILDQGNKQKEQEENPKQEEKVLEPDIIIEPIKDKKKKEENLKDKDTLEKSKSRENFEHALFNFLICLFLGVIGVHRFIEGKILTGLLYLFTGGLFFIGYAVDCVIRLIKLISAALNLITDKAA